MALDPIVSLSVAIAEAPGSYAFFVGSGVSRDAGVPTGSEVLWQAVGELYRLENATAETPDRVGLEEWLEATGRGEIDYSGVLEEIAPDPATRRDYLAKHFEGVEPGDPHERLADLASRGLVKVLVTTNFDRLLERALQVRGVEPVVVTSDADLGVAPRREHASCYVLKPHGDYLQQTIRNTAAELTSLDPRMDGELREVFDRYGLVVLGYSGADEAIAEAMRARRSRYGLYWVTRGALAEPVRSLIEAADGRVIVREGAAEFLADLEGRLAVFEAQPSGLTPLTVHDEVISLLRRGDRVGLHDLLRRERRELEARIGEVVAEGRNSRPDESASLAAHAALLPALERRLASLLPLALHETEVLDEEIGALATSVERQARPDGYVFWQQLIDWCAWWLGTTIGALAVRDSRFSALTPLFEARRAEAFGDETASLLGSDPGEAARLIGIAVMAQVDDKRYFAPYWEALKLDLSSLELLHERYPELVAGEDEPSRSLAEFDFLHSIALGIRGERVVSKWPMSGPLVEAFARRLHGDARLRERVARATGEELDGFDQKAPDALRSAHLLGNDPLPDAIAILEQGSAR